VSWPLLSRLAGISRRQGRSHVSGADAGAGLAGRAALLRDLADNGADQPDFVAIGAGRGAEYADVDTAAGLSANAGAERDLGRDDPLAASDQHRPHLYGHRAEDR